MKEATMEKTQFAFSLMDQDTANIILRWRYEGAYAIYNMEGDEAMAELLDLHSPYYAVRDERGELIGFLNVGTSSLVWESNEPGIYVDHGSIGIGLGMRPDLTGQGMGQAFVQACLDFVRRKFALEHFRLYVLTWNERAIRVYEKVGFRRVRSFLQSNMHGEREFLEMARDA
jgi:[ribosomal protein S18]-alanine N-acetyltransferase